jgi:hypothetical protein
LNGVFGGVNRDDLRMYHKRGFWAVLTQKRSFIYMFWKKIHSKLGSATSAESNEEFIQQKARLFDTPVHEVARKEIELPSDEDGLGWASGIKTRRWAFKHFDRFEDKIHKLHSEGQMYNIGPWRLEQLSDPYLNNFGIDDGPIIGLRFRIFYNSEDVGSFEICPMSEPDPEYGEAKYSAMIDLDIFPAPFLPYEHISSFLKSCVTELFPFGEAGFREASIVSALTAAMWEANRQDSMWTSLNFGYSGSVAFDPAS